MAYTENMQVVSGPVSADASSNQYKCYARGASQWALLASAGVRVDGILQDTPAAAARAGQFAVAGVCKGLAGEAITAGNLVCALANGKLGDSAVTALNVAGGAGDPASDPVKGAFVVGRALEAASGDGSVISVLLMLHAGDFAAP